MARKYPPKRQTAAIHARVSPAEREKLISLAEAWHITESAVIRILIHSATPKAFEPVVFSKIADISE